MSASRVCPYLGVVADEDITRTNSAVCDHQYAPITVRYSPQFRETGPLASIPADCRSRVYSDSGILTTGLIALRSLISDIYYSVM